MFRMYGNRVEVLRYQVDYTENAEQFTVYAATEEEADEIAQRYNGVKSALALADDEWMDGLEVADVPDTYAEAIRIYSLGKESYFNNIRTQKQNENKSALADWLYSHPLLWTDGNPYGVTEEDQKEMALNLMQYQVAVQAGQPKVLEWHAQKESCRTFEQQEYVALSLAIADYVYPYLRYQESVKEAIYQAQTAEEVADVKIDYASVGS